jgi:hypothetical protein
VLIARPKLGGLGLGACRTSAKRPGEGVLLTPLMSEVAKHVNIRHCWNHTGELHRLVVLKKLGALLDSGFRHQNKLAQLWIGDV